MEKYDSNMPVSFKTGTHKIVSDANFNFQLNRVIFWDGGDEAEVCRECTNIKTSEDWTRTLTALEAKAHKEGRTQNEIAYARMAEFFMYDSDPQKQAQYQKAAALFYEYYADYFESGKVSRHFVPYQGGKLPVMVAKSADNGGGASRGTILFHGGNDSYFEELFFPMLYLAQGGYDVYLFEGPGQGGVLRVQNMKFTHEWEKPVSAILDYFKLENVAIIGASLGGYLAPRAAAFEKRINKVIAWSIFPDFFHVVLSDHPGNVASFIEKILSSPVRNIMNGFYKKMMKQDELVRWNLLHGMYAYDAKTPMEYIARIRKFTLHGIADKITQDVLVLGAREDHFINPRLFHEEFDLLTNARSLTLRLFSEKDNAGGHCNVGNSKLVLDAMLSWLNGR